MAHELIAHAIALVIAVRDRDVAHRRLGEIVRRVHGGVSPADAPMTYVVEVPASAFGATTAALGDLGVVRGRHDESIDVRQDLQKDDDAIRGIARAQSSLRALPIHPVDLHAKPMAHVLSHRRNLLDAVATARITVRFVR